ncbi:prim-pol domain-containing protein [Nadsonia fulvescens var. elongata DSM 6958]|uniref:DNA primase n=1 Tax=Nadsonia fulvescens var. elongata DSM 6958 TaxID=857566 RepID=A0A1E3PK24_9ASCO|nr:prim-pol domain-containing protein [Nadsonia fulvescens var. elongata DSM 6958]
MKYSTGPLPRQPTCSTQTRPLALDQVSPEEMLQFYQRLFPYRYFFQWLNHSPSPSPDFTHREIAFTLQSDIYSRYNSFKGYEDFKKEVLRLNPLRFEIGPQYTANPRDKKLLRKGAFRPLTKELVFDIDLTDYDEIRTCCSKTQICIKCWQFITVAIRTMTLGLKEDFGFKNIIWIFSGRRGAHAWVCDKRARELDDQKRRAIAHYFALSRNGTTVKKRMNLKRPLHPHISRSLEILKDDFQVNILEEQDPWETNDGENILLNLLPERNTELNKELRAFWLDNPGRTSYKKWKDIDDFAKKGVQKNLSTKELQYAKQDIILQYMYPRLDIEVSNKLNHLLKSPFVVHPKTGKVCVPIELDNYEDFDPEDVPTVDQLLNEIDSFNKELNESKDEMADIKISDYEKTSLKIYIDYFAKFVKSVMEEEAEIKKTFSAGKRSLDF